MKRKDYGIGGWVDERIPRAEIDKALIDSGVEDAEFCDWLSGAVGTYRGVRDANASMPTRTEEISALQDFKKAMASAAHYLSHGGLPPIAHAVITAHLWKTEKLSIHDEFSSTVASLQNFEYLAEIAEAQLRSATNARGAKEDHRRAILFSQVCDRLRGDGLTADRARALCAEVLVLCRVEVPEDERHLRRLNARGAELRK